MGWYIFSNNNCTLADPKISIQKKVVSVSSEENRVVSVPAEGAVAAGVGAVVNVVGTRRGVGGGVGVAARCLSIPWLGIISIGDIGGALVAVLVLGGPGLPGKAWWHPVDGHPGHPLELHVLQGDDQEPWPSSRDGDKGGKNQDLHLRVAVCKSLVASCRL